MLRSCAILLPPILAATPVLAQDIVVTGQGLDAPAGEAAYDVVTIGRDRLTQSASGRLEDVLRDAAGFQQFRRSDSRSAHPTSQGATLRGLGGNASSRALILLDGVPQVDPFGGWVNWTAFDPDRLGLVRVTRGGGSGVFGSGALAGTIELFSAGPTQLPLLWASASYGSRDGVEAGAGISGALSGGFATLSANYARGDGFIPIVERSRGPVDEAARYEQASVAARAAVPVGGDTELQASLLGLLDRRTRGVDFTPNRNLGADASVRLVGRGRWGWEAAAWLQVREFSSGFASVNPTRTTVNPTLDQYNVPATGIGARAEVRPPLGQGLELRLGADARQTEGATKELFTFVAGSPTRSRRAGGRTRMLGAFADGTVKAAERLTLTAGGRIDRWWIDRGRIDERTIATGDALRDESFADRSGWEGTARGGIAYRPAGAVTLRGAAYLGWRLPTLNELYRPFRVGAELTQANATLEPERLRGIDAGIDYRPLSNIRFGATVFWNRMDDAIANVTIGTNLRERRNLEAIRSRGVELDGEAGWGALSLAAAYSCTDARVRASGQAGLLDGRRPAQTPKHQASASLGWARPEGPRARLTVRYVGTQFEDDLNVRRLDDAVTLDAAAAFPIGSGWSAEARAENLVDATVEAGSSGANIIERATPRTLWIGLRYAR